MAHLAEQFKTALANIEPSDTDTTNAAAAHAEVRAVLEADSTLSGWGIDPILIGSYRRKVSVRRVKDVDVFCRLTTPPDDLRPGRALDEMQRALEAEYGDRVEPQHRSFKIDFPSFGLSVDAVPARPCADHWEIPSRPDARAAWMETNPTELTRLTEQMNRSPRLGTQGVYVPTVKMVRQIRRAQLNDEPPGGLYLELCTYWAFDAGVGTQSSFAGYLTSALSGVADVLDAATKDGLADPTLDGSIISTRATGTQLRAAADAFRAAADLAERALNEADDCKSAVMWAELFGENPDGRVFELPGYCNADGSTREGSASTRTPGATRVPAGSGRYA